MFIRKLKRSLLIFSCLALLAAGCGIGEDKQADTWDTTKVVKIVYYDEMQFFRDYGELLYAKFNNLEIEVANTSSIYPINPEPNFDFDKAFEEFIERERPDILMLNINQYKDLYERGMLVDIEPLIQADQYDLETFVPGVLDYLREASGGKLHGLAPRFHATALYYNAELFRQHGVPLPTDQMSWQEVLELAHQFPKDGAEDERVYGFALNSYSQYYDIVQQIATTEGLMFVNPDQEQMTIGSDRWRSIIEMVVGAFHAGTIKPPETDNNSGMIGMSYEDYLISHPFVAGKTAMFVDGPYLIDQLRQARERLPDKANIEYEIVTAPVDPNDRERGGQLSVYNIFALNAGSESLDAAWEVLKYINSDDIARIKSRSTFELLTRTNTVPERDGRSIEAFYKLKPVAMNSSEEFSKLPSAFYGMFYSLMNEQLKAAVEDDKPISDVIQTLLDEGTKQLIQAREMEAEMKDAQPPEAVAEVIAGEVSE